MNEVTFSILLILLLSVALALSGCSELPVSNKDLVENSSELPKAVTEKTEKITVTDSGANRTKPENEYRFGIEDVDPYVIAEDPEGWFARQSARGVGVIAFQPFDLDGYMIFNSPSLKKAGFKPDQEYPNLLEEIFKEAEKHNMTVILMIEGVAHIIGDAFPYSDEINPDALTPGAVEGLIDDIAEVSSKYNVRVYVSEEAFEDEYIDAISKATKRNNMGYMHFFEDLKCRADVYVSEDYAYYPYDARNSKEDREYLIRIWKLGSYYGELGFLNVMYGAAKGCGKEASTLTAGGWGLGDKTHQNIALMRSIQYNPSAYYFVVAVDRNGSVDEDEEKYAERYNFREQLFPLLQKYAGQRRSEETMSVANLVLHEPESGEEIADFYSGALLSSMSAVTNAMLASSHRIIVTKEPVEKADMYYVFTPGKIFDEELDLPEWTDELINSGRPVFFQTAGEIPQTENWKKVISALGISEYHPIVNGGGSYIDPIPETVNAKFPEGIFEIKYAGYSFEFPGSEDAGKYSEGHILNCIHPSSLDAETEVLLTGMTAASDGGRHDDGFGDETALILKRGSVYFVNGGYMHLDSSSILANIMLSVSGNASNDAVYNRPSYGYLTVRDEIAVFFAPYDVEVSISLNKNLTEVIEFDENGDEVMPGVKVDDGNLYGTVGRFHLVVVTADSEGASWDEKRW